ncbi:hypothetical protein K438DRAFT_1968644 [Mycena galopus ATCC 62051]|nr:hypothetical protein K438DRAFT_1968644 [Mycena galopus ATCC 62051]
MARNQEKALSTLYYFGEAQAVALELGLGRGRQAAAHGERVQELARVQAVVGRAVERDFKEAGLSDYELRNLNDEINHQIREK